MFNTATVRQQVAALFCTVLMSTTCVLSAVGPAQADGMKPVVAKTAAIVA